MTLLELADQNIRIFQLKSGTTCHAFCWGKETKHADSPYRSQPLERIININKTKKKSIKKYKQEFKKCVCKFCEKALL